MSSSQLFERPQSGETAILVHVDFGTGQDGDLDEFNELVVSAGATPVEHITASRQKADAKFFVGSGKAEEIKAAIDSLDADVVLFNHSLSASQERNLEKFFGRRVLDRTGLILDIFAQRARSFEGKLQVELAQLKHLSTRLVRGWTHLERQKGGIGLRGPGETQLETDRRLLGARIKQLQKRLDKVNQHRNLSRQARAKKPAFTVSLVGYTNAGKSTLFNSLTEASSYVADQLFATLDPTLRRLKLPGVGDVVLADTVGFIRNLPHDLVAAFRSTLQETQEADLLLHVVDLSNPEHQHYCEQVNEVLEQIGADQIPRVMVYNKIDLMDKTAEYLPAENERNASVYVSAAKKQGMESLQDAIKYFFKAHTVEGWIHLGVNEGRLRALLFNEGEVLAELQQSDGSILLHVRVGQDRLYRESIDNARFFAESSDALSKTVAGAA